MPSLARADVAVGKLVRAARANGEVSDAEWTEIEALAAKLPPISSPATRRLLDVWADESLSMSEETRAAMGLLLGTQGYDTSVPRAPGTSLAKYVAQVRETNVSEDDRGFQKLLRLTGREGQKQVIAVLDGGVDLLHPALRDKLWTNEDEIPGNALDDDGDGRVDDVHGWDFVDNDAALLNNDHGTHVTGLASQGSENLEVLSARVIGMRSVGKETAAAIDYAAANGARVINLSFKVMKDDTALVKAAIERHPDILFLKSAGNEAFPLDHSHFTPDTYLASNTLDNLAVIAASTREGALAPFSNHGAPWATLGTRGADVYSTGNSGQYVRQSGTSAATPHVTAVAGKALVLDPGLTPSALKGILTATSEVLPEWKELNLAGGLVNEEAALKVAALTGLMRGGLTVEQAADRLALKGTARSTLTALAQKHL